MTDDDTIKIVQDTYPKHFAQNILFKFIRCKMLLKDIQSNDNRYELLNNYHSKSNSRTIQENFEHLKSECYFPYSFIKTAINTTNLKFRELTIKLNLLTSKVEKKKKNYKRLSVDHKIYHGKYGLYGC